MRDDLPGDVRRFRPVLLAGATVTRAQHHPRPRLERVPTAPVAAAPTTSAGFSLSRRAVVRWVSAGDGLGALAATAVAVSAHGTLSGGTPPVPATAFATLAVAWLLGLRAVRAYDERTVLGGTDEPRRLLLAAVLVLGAVGTGSWATGSTMPPGPVTLALLLATLAALGQRRAWRSWIRRSPLRDRLARSTLLLGRADDVAAMVARIAGRPDPVHRLAGCCLPSTAPGYVVGAPVVGRWDDVADVVRRCSIDTVVVVSPCALEDPALSGLARDLERGAIDLLATSAGTRPARVRVEQLWGAPLLRLAPEGWAGRSSKAVADRVLAALLLVVLLPALLAIALAVRTTAGGPVLHRQPRVGLHGRTFGMLGFRTASTSTGSFLRRHGLDRLPQLLNVVAGDMSLVGLRPTPL